MISNCEISRDILGYFMCKEIYYNSFGNCMNLFNMLQYSFMFIHVKKHNIDEKMKLDYVILRMNFPIVLDEEKQHLDVMNVKMDIMKRKRYVLNVQMDVLNVRVPIIVHFVQMNFIFKNFECISCYSIDKCTECSNSKCIKCEKGYDPNDFGTECDKKSNITLIGEII